MNIGNNIKKFRNKKGLTQKELAKKINVTHITIQNYENNRREPKIETLDKIAVALDIPVTHLLGITETDKNGMTVTYAVPKEMTEKYKSKELSEDEKKEYLVKYLKKLYNKNPLDQHVSNIYKKYKSNSLTDKDWIDIDGYREGQKRTIQLLGDDEVIRIDPPENESYELFKKMLKSMDYDVNKFNTTVLFKIIKSQIEFILFYKNNG